MITTMRVPIYLMLESDNLDRAKITKLLDQMILPEIVRILITIGNKSSFNQMEDVILKQTLGESWTMKLVTDVQAMAKKTP